MDMHRTDTTPTTESVVHLSSSSTLVAISVDDHPKQEDQEDEDDDASTLMPMSPVMVRAGPRTACLDDEGVTATDIHVDEDIHVNDADDVTFTRSAATLSATANAANHASDGHRHQVNSAKEEGNVHSSTNDVEARLTSSSTSIASFTSIKQISRPTLSWWERHRRRCCWATVAFCLMLIGVLIAAAVIILTFATPGVVVREVVLIERTGFWEAVFRKGGGLVFAWTFRLAIDNRWYAGMAVEMILVTMSVICATFQSPRSLSHSLSLSSLARIIGYYIDHINIEIIPADAPRMSPFQGNITALWLPPLHTTVTNLTMDITVPINTRLVSDYFRLRKSCARGNGTTLLTYRVMPEVHVLGFQVQLPQNVIKNVTAPCPLALM